MRAYEFLARVSPEGKLELPDVKLKDLPYNPVVRVIVLVEEASDVEEDENKPTDEESLNSAVESFRQSWHEARTGQRIPLSQLWQGIETDAE